MIATLYQSPEGPIKTAYPNGEPVELDVTVRLEAVRRDEEKIILLLTVIHWDPGVRRLAQGWLPVSDMASAGWNGKTQDVPAALHRMFNDMAFQIRMRGLTADYRMAINAYLFDLRGVLMLQLPEQLAGAGLGDTITVEHAEVKG